MARAVTHLTSAAALQSPALHHEPQKTASTLAAIHAQSMQPAVGDLLLLQRVGGALHKTLAQRFEAVFEGDCSRLWVAQRTLWACPHLLPNKQLFAKLLGV